MEKLQGEIVKTPTMPSLPLDQVTREKYLALELGRVASDQIWVVPVDSNEIEKDVTVHPTSAGTNVLLAAMDNSYEADLILNEKFTTTERLYAGV